jgi:ParB-like chromosome segregation protein Spo0J
MVYNICLLEHGLLRQHEKINDRHVEELVCQIAQDGCVRDPIIVDKRTLIILDGHHRFNALKKLGLVRIPVCLCRL